jgi:SAM-dependent methyltransferase
MAVAMSEASKAHFSDHFSGVAAGYAAHRPKYPDELLDFLANACARRELAWDCGCGSGQLSVALASRFQHVVATDASEKQIAAATPHPSVEYRRAGAEASGLEKGSVDLCVAAQAAHWFDLETYYTEVWRVSRLGATVALVTYATPLIDEEVDRVIASFYWGPLDKHWPPERRHTEDGYRSLTFPFLEIEAPKLEIRMEWSLEQFLGYLETWSAILAMQKAEGRERIEGFRADLAHAWGPEGTVKTVHWPIGMRVGRVG